ncbi:MAG: GNAT family N-acetyltransferase [Bacteroidetes bacterium]|nr:GNAT family N-acetyltransferase [Bacteroidota bacterium]
MKAGTLLFEAGVISYFEGLPNPEDYCNLFFTTNWNEEYHFTKEEIIYSVQNTWYFISAYDEDKMVGTGAIISDGIHHALIVNMIVHPDYQCRGIGTQILKLLVKKCKDHRVRDIQLFAAKDKFPFYMKHGFSFRPDDAPGMQLNKM